MRLLVGVLLTAVCAFAQTASLTGRVTDSSGAVVPGASITLAAEGTGLEAKTESNDEGNYRLPSLAPGVYRLTVNKAGFKPIRQSNLQLIVQQVARLDFTLEVGSTTDTVEVSAQAVLLESETATLGQVVDGQRVRELPLLGRNAYALASLVPGVRIANGMNDLPVDQISTASASINGSRGNQNEYLLDGAPNTAPAQNQPVIYQNVDSVQEFKVETNSFSAEYGRAAGGVFNVVTKSGTNDWTFSAYEFLRNNALNANDFFANRAGRPRAPFRFNQFGGVIGGPIQRNKTFFFGAAELVRFAQGVTVTSTIPRPDQLGGDFSANSPLIYDPLTTTQTPAGFTRAAFPGNRIPADRLDPVARSMARFWPAPNATGAFNYVLTDANRITKDTWSMRLDHHFNEKNRLFGRYSYDKSPINRVIAYGKDNQGSPAFGPQVFTRYNTVVEDTHVFSPSLLATLRLSYARLSNFRTPFSAGFDITSLGLPAALKQQIGNPPSFPAIAITGFATAYSVPNAGQGGTLGGNDYIAFGMDNYALLPSITKTFSNHTLKAGADIRLIRFAAQQFADNWVNFGFTPAFTQGPDLTRPAGGNALASFLLGIGSGSVQPAPALAMQTKYYAGYVQDDWKITPRLTVNLGLRYDFESPRTDRFNQLANFDYTQRVPLNTPGLNLTGTLSFVGVGGLPRYQTNPDRNNWAPRVGLAYRLGAKTVIRTGAGIFYGTTTGIGGAAGAFGTSGFLTTTNVVTSLDGVTPRDYLRNPYPQGLLRATGNTQGAATLLGQAVSFTDRGMYLPYSAQWNFSIQRELPWRVLFDIGYAGSRGIGFGENRQVNTLPDAALSQRDALRTQVPNPFFGQIAIGGLSARTVAQAQLLRPFPHFDTVTSLQSSLASSTYHSMQLKIEKRYAKGFTILGSYTFSKLLDLQTGAFSGDTLSSGAVQNWNNLAAEWAVSGLDQTHRLVTSAVWALPFFKTGPGLVTKTLGGWELGAINTFSSGGPIGVTSAVNNTFSQGGGQRPNWNGVNPVVANRDVNRWFDTSAFSAPPAYTYGNAPRTFGGARTDAAQQLDLTLSKTTQIRERLRLQFRTEFFNLTNSPRFSVPNAVFGNPQFGIVGAQLNQPRIVQFALKLMY